MRHRNILVYGLIICMIMTATLFISCGESEPEEEPVPQMTEEQTLKDLTEEPDEEDFGLAELNDSYVDEDEPLAATLEEALPALKEAGYNKTADGYKATDNVDGVRSTRIIKAKGNKVTADLTYDYGADNDEMKKFFKENPDNAVSVMVSQYLTVLADRSTAKEGTLDYVIHVGGSKVMSGKMSLKEARKLQEESAGE